MQNQEALPLGEKLVSLALFDFDGVLIPGDSVVYYLRYARKRGAVNGREYAKALWAAALYGMKRLTDAESKAAALAFRKRHDPQYLDGLDKDFVHEVLVPKFSEAGKQRVAQHRREGKTLLMVSASTENYMRFVAEALGFDALLATPIEPDGTVKHNCKGEEKAKRVKAWLKDRGLTADFASSRAYGDSKSDLPMLRLVGHPVQVNPKKALRKLAPEMETEEWKNR